MKHSSYYKGVALDALKGKWPMAVLTGFLASLLGGGILSSSSGGSGSSSNSSSNSYLENFYYELQTSEIWNLLHAAIVVTAIILVIWGIVQIIIGGAASLGYAKFNLNLIDYKNADISDLFSQFHRLWDGFCMNFLVGLYIFLWSLLLIIPGIIKTYSYAMTPYIMAENPEMTVSEAIKESMRIMDGQKMSLFFLNLSFIGWDMLISAPSIFGLSFVTARMVNGGSLSNILFFIPCALITFTGFLFLHPYIAATNAAFYRDISAPKATYEPTEQTVEF